MPHSIDEYRPMSTLIKDFRKSKKWTQAQLANRLGVKQALVSKIENGEADISKDIALKLHKMAPRKLPLLTLLELNID